MSAKWIFFLSRWFNTSWTPNKWFWAVKYPRFAWFSTCFGCGPELYLSKGHPADMTPPYFPLPRHITFVYRLLHWTGVILLLTFSLCSVGDLRNMERVLLFLHLFLWFPPNLLHPVKGECVRCCRGSDTVVCTHPVLQQFVCFQLLNDVLLGFLFSVENGYCVLVLVIEEPRFQKCETKLLCI